MPKETFFNLPAEKRQHILNVATEEFADYGYQAASISRIVAAAGIAKGSFYQYFADKSDLFIHLLNEGARLKAEFLATHPPSPAQDMFDYWRSLLKSGVDFEIENPRLAKVAYEAVTGGAPRPPDFDLQIHQLAEAFAQGLIQQGVKNGSVNPDFDPNLMGFILMAVSLQLGQYIVGRLDISPEHILTDSPSRDELNALYDQLIDILKFGMGKA